MVYGIVYDPNEKGIVAPMEYTLMVYSPNGRGMVKRYGQKIKKYRTKDTMSIKISFMHYMKWAIVMLPAVFEEFEIVYIFFAIFFFLVSLSIRKRLKICKKYYSWTLGSGDGAVLNALKLFSS